MGKIILMIVLLITSSILFAQMDETNTESRPLNSFNINLLGDASFVSLNFEKQFLISSNFILAAQVGFGYIQEFLIFGNNPENYITVPHHITGNLGRGKHFLEFGLGGTLINGNTAQPYIMYPIIGYRFLPLKSNKMNFRIYAEIPFSGLETSGILFVPVGLSFGISF